MLSRREAEHLAEPAVVSAKRAPVLLTMAGFAGTLAAVRCFGRAGLRVVVASDGRLRPAAWSRCVTQTVRCPPASQPARFLEWLLEFGAQHPGHFLYPTGDDLAHLFARYRQELSKNFLLYQPSEPVILDLLDKSSLYAACSRLAIDTPRTFIPETEADLARVAAEASFPLLFKPRTNVMFTPVPKDRRARRRSTMCWRVERREDLTPTYHSYRQQNAHAPEIIAARPGIELPILQEYHASEGGIESIAGFIDESGDLLVARASNKIFQRPRSAGIGICFEQAPLDEVVLQALRRLCSLVGYYGVFEAEFVRKNGRRMLIDFNPRFYGQMGFEIARGLPLPLLAYSAASGDRQALAKAVEDARAFQQEPGQVYCHRFALGMVITAQRVAGRMKRPEARWWRQWVRSHKSLAIDAAYDRADPVPFALEALVHIADALRHPGGFVRAIVFDR